MYFSHGRRFKAIVEMCEKKANLAPLSLLATIHHKNGREFCSLNAAAFFMASLLRYAFYKRSVYKYS